MGLKPLHPWLEVGLQPAGCSPSRWANCRGSSGKAGVLRGLGLRVPFFGSSPGSGYWCMVELGKNRVRITHRFTTLFRLKAKWA